LLLAASHLVFAPRLLGSSWNTQPFFVLLQDWMLRLYGLAVCISVGIVAGQEQHEHSNWMGELLPVIGNQTLLDLSLPGTHDTQTYDLSLVGQHDVVNHMFPLSTSMRFFRT